MRPPDGNRDQGALRSDGVAAKSGDDDGRVLADRHVTAIGKGDACRTGRDLPNLGHRIDIDIGRGVIDIQMKHNPFRHVSQSSNRPRVPGHAADTKPSHADPPIGTAG